MQPKNFFLPATIKSNNTNAEKCLKEITEENGFH
jgi:hypothetical protein